MSDTPRIKIHTFGCQMNQLDSEIVRETLHSSGYRIVDDENEAEVILFNTCSVRDHAEERVLQRIRQINRPGVKIGLLGCLAQRQGEQLFKTLRKRLHIVCGTRRFPLIDDLVARALNGEERVIDVSEDQPAAPGMVQAHDRPLHRGMQGYVSVMRGCNNFCTYCIVPYVRGREESRPEEAVVEEVRSLVERGAMEVTLLGQNIDAYGKDTGTTLGALLRAVHDGIPALRRLRFVTSHPRDITRDLLKTVADLPRVARHLHMPAQSGSDLVLAAMRRGYTRAVYEEKLAAVRELVPGMLVTSDFIVGFPGETERDFDRTADLVRAAGFQTSYVFKYSPRPGTVASRDLPDDVPEEEKKRRNQILLQLQEEHSRARNGELVGTEVVALVEGPSERDKTRLTGRTSNNLICTFPLPEGTQADLYAGRLVCLRVTDATPLSLYAEFSRFTD